MDHSAMLTCCTGKPCLQTDVRYINNIFNWQYILLRPLVNPFKDTNQWNCIDKIKIIHEILNACSEYMTVLQVAEQLDGLLHGYVYIPVLLLTALSPDYYWCWLCIHTSSAPDCSISWLLLVLAMYTYQFCAWLLYLLTTMSIIHFLNILQHVQ